MMVTTDYSHAVMIPGRPRPLHAGRHVARLALSAFFGKHAAMFKSDNFAPVCESYFDDDDDLEVRFTVPYEAFADFDLTESPEHALDSPAPAAPFQPRAGRNEPVRTPPASWSARSAAESGPPHHR